ncbi:hypothetical protein [Gloeobacter kilaueensis]|uniref:Uncharacterized protein n=1 Tax=Gloeobacter kilaueensis (strain ATCC BAA-2537 / CCAP 1431/1 / ULC 316 / JS1) TaxID=1183438 RepID=U5QQC1_GLOK1|nr:hypothetical protein [Gloeobacter kilaueensis]AGY59875.1 hypothetical protein GKIL_3629 [Gloeobacter kilaueensis JS1]
MNHGEFQKRLKALAAAREGQFGYPFVSLKAVAEALALGLPELSKHLDQERQAGRLVMNPIDEKTEENLPTGLIAVHLKDADGTSRSYVSLALKP